MGQTCNMEAQLAELDSFIDSLQPDSVAPKDGALISVLHKAQDIFGYLSKDVQNHVAHKLQVPSSKVFGVVTFYSFFNTEPKGKKQVNICLGTACFVRGAEKVLEELKKELKIEAGTTSADGQFSLDTLRCVGACGLAPVISINGRVYGRVAPEDIKGIIQEQMLEGSLDA